MLGCSCFYFHEELNENSESIMGHNYYKVPFLKLSAGVASPFESLKLVLV